MQAGGKPVYHSFIDRSVVRLPLGKVLAGLGKRENTSSSSDLFFSYYYNKFVFVQMHTRTHTHVEINLISSSITFRGTDNDLR